MFSVQRGPMEHVLAHVIMRLTATSHAIVLLRGVMVGGGGCSCVGSFPAPNCAACQAQRRLHYCPKAAQGRTWGVLEKRTSTGKVRPGIWKTGTLPKKLENFWASSVAEVTMRRKSRRRATTWPGREGAVRGRSGGCGGWMVYVIVRGSSSAASILAPRSVPPKATQNTTPCPRHLFEDAKEHVGVEGALMGLVHDHGRVPEGGRVFIQGRRLEGEAKGRAPYLQCGLWVGSVVRW